MNKKLLKILSILLLGLVIHSTTAKAALTNDYGCIGNITVAPGERVTLWVPDDVYSIASGGYYPSCGWSLSSNYYGHVKLVSQNTWYCTIEGVSAISENVQLKFNGNCILYDAMWQYKGYYNIKVKSPDIKVTSISLNVSSSSLKVGETKQLSATVSPSNATDKSVTWSSSNTSVATVSSSGLVTAKSVGSATVTCRANDGSGKSTTCSVLVSASDPIKVTSVSLNVTSASLVVGDTKLLAATISPSNATDKSITWTSSNNNVASVNSSGVVTAKARGTAIIMCKANDGSGRQATCDVTVSTVKDYSYFTAKTKEGVELKYYVQKVSSGECRLNNPVMDKDAVVSITIPDEVEGLKVTSIFNSAFSDYSGVTAIIVPSTVTEIGNSAFRNCTGLTSVMLGNRVKRLGPQVFRGCSSLSTITGVSNLEYIGGNAFQGQSDGTYIPWYNNLPDGPLYIGKVLFKYKGTIPDNTVLKVLDGTTSIGYQCCSGNGLVAVMIPASVTDIGFYAFNYCRNLSSITVAAGNEKYDSRNNCNAIVETAKNIVIIGCKNTTFPSTVRAIDGYAFYGTGLTDLVIPNNIDSIVGSAFAYNTNLSSVIIGGGLRTMEGSYIDNPFRGCSSLSEIVVSSDNPYYDSRNNCNAIIEKSTDRLVSGCKNTIIPTSVRAIGTYAFENMSQLTSVTIPDNVEKIENSAFYGCSKLHTLSLGKGIEKIDERAFYGCYGLATIFSQALKPAELDGSAFSNYTSDTDRIYNNATLYVPTGTRINYITTEVWNKFKTLKEFDPTGINHVSVQKDPPSGFFPIYNLSGQRLDKPRKGINIIGGKKVMVK